MTKKRQGDFLTEQPQYQQYIDSCEVRVVPCRYGIKRTSSQCDGGNENGGEGNVGTDGGNGINGPSSCYTWGEFYVDEAPYMDGNSVAVDWEFCWDANLGNDQLDFGSVLDPVTENTRAKTILTRRLNTRQANCANCN